MIRNKILGLVYLDSGIARKLLTEEDENVLYGVCQFVAAFLETSKTQQTLQTILRLSLSSNAILDPREQSRVILDEIIKAFGAQRAFIFLKDKVSIEPSLGRTHDGKDLDEIRGYSKSILNEVMKTNDIVIMTADATGNIQGSESAVAYDLRSILAAPLFTNDVLMGVIYLDSQISNGVFRKEDSDLLMTMAKHISVAFETAKVTQLELERKEMEKGLELTAMVQNLLLPKSSSFKDERLELTSIFNPADKSGGDWWFHHRYNADKHVIVLADVTGHGVGSAMVTALIAGIYRTLEKMLTISETTSLLNKLELLHNLILDIIDNKYWMTLSLVEVDCAARKATWYSAGAPPLLLKADEQVRFVTSRGLPLGSSGGFKVTTTEFPFPEGAQIFLFTDGIYEAKIAERNLGLKGLKGMYELAMESTEVPSEQIHNLVQQLQKVDALIDDDLTLILVKNIQASA